MKMCIGKIMLFYTFRNLVTICMLTFFQFSYMHFNNFAGSV